jgi:hypothetical protein
MQVIKNKVPSVIRILLGALFVVFGANGFLNFLPTPAATGSAGAFLGGLAAAGYMFPLIKATEILVGLALVTNRFVPLALTVLAPISINIFAYHLFLAPQGIGIAALIIGLQVALAWYHREAFRSVLAARSSTKTATTGSKLATNHAA